MEGKRIVNLDLHNHFRTGSYIPKWMFNKAVMRIEKKLGYGGICGLVNFSDNRCEKFIELAGYILAAKFKRKN